MEFLPPLHPIGKQNQNDMENRISIPKPCHEKWNEMLPEQQGRHCLACCKTVVDFTSWEADDILVYLQQKNSEKVCGRFNQDQVMEMSPLQNDHLIQSVMQARMPLLRKMAAVIVICFGLIQGGDSYGQKVKGKIACPKPTLTEQLLGEAAIQPDTAKQHQPVIADTTKPQIMGMIMPYQPKEQKAIKKTTIRKKNAKR
jgi:hypothetical protein